MIKQKKTWVLVADGTRARLFIKKFKAIEHLMGHDLVGDNLRDSEIYMDKPGRSFESANPTRHAYQPRTDWHDYQKQLFAKEICSVLEKAHEQDEFDELIIITPAKMLGNIRNYLGKQILPKIAAEISKDISKLSDHELLSYLEREMA